MTPQELLEQQAKTLIAIKADLDAQGDTLKGIRAELVEQRKEHLNGNEKVNVVNFNMPLMALAGLMVKIALASVPAFVVLWLLAMALQTVIAMLVFQGRIW